MKLICMIMTILAPITLLVSPCTGDHLRRSRRPQPTTRPQSLFTRPTAIPRPRPTHRPTTTIPTTSGGCPNGFIPNHGNCFHFSSDATLGKTANWEQARQNCQNLGIRNGVIADLAELGNPNNELSDEFLMATITSKGKVCWLGAHDPNHNNNWFWVHTHRALSVQFPFWGPTEPNRKNTENCLVTWKFGDLNPQRQYIADYICSVETYYVCQTFN